MYDLFTMMSAQVARERTKHAEIGRENQIEIAVNTALPIILSRMTEYINKCRYCMPVVFTHYFSKLLDAHDHEATLSGITTRLTSMIQGLGYRVSAHDYGSDHGICIWWTQPEYTNEEKAAKRNAAILRIAQCKTQPCESWTNSRVL